MPQLQFHWYGFLIALGVIAGLYVSEYLFNRELSAEKKKTDAVFFWQLVPFVIVGGLIGSRAWHVATDFQLYAGHLQDVFAVWNGGLSIIGTLIGAAFSFFLFFKLNPQWTKYERTVLDVSVFGLALGQAIGRIGNYINEELYGLPTHLPWGIPIDLGHRLPGYESYTIFHPLFAYEALLLLLFMAVAWELHKNVLKIGSGLLFVFYIVYYSWIRFGLDFLRIDKASSPILGLGVNQVVLLVVGILSVGFLLKRMELEQKVEQK